MTFIPNRQIFPRFFSKFFLRVFFTHARKRASTHARTYIYNTLFWAYNQASKTPQNCSAKIFAQLFCKIIWWFGYKFITLHPKRYKYRPLTSFTAAVIVSPPIEIRRKRTVGELLTFVKNVKMCSLKYR